MTDFSTITLGALLSHENETIRRNATSILKQLQRAPRIVQWLFIRQNKIAGQCHECEKYVPEGHGYHAQEKGKDFTVTLCDKHRFSSKSTQKQRHPIHIGHSDEHSKKCATRKEYGNCPPWPHG